MIPADRPPHEMRQIFEAIVEQLTTLPASEVTLRLEIDAEVPSDLDRRKVQTLLESANTLGFIDEALKLERSAVSAAARLPRVQGQHRRRSFELPQHCTLLQSTPVPNPEPAITQALAEDLRQTLPFDCEATVGRHAAFISLNVALHSR